MGYSIEQAAKKAGVSLERYLAWEKGDKRPTYKQLEDLAENVYKRSLAILLLPHPPKEAPVQKDFRNLTNAENVNLSPELILALRKAKRYQLILEEVAASNEPPQFTKFKVSINEDAKMAALKFRKFLSLTLTEQKQWKPEDAFRNFKRKIEEIGIYVFQTRLSIQEARAFCLTGQFPIIVLNTDDALNGRTFSLFHEVCHLLFNINDVFKDLESGELNNDYKKIENFCNQFAASFLVPEDAFLSDVQAYGLSNKNVTDNTIRELAQSYNVSNEVIGRRLMDLSVITEDFFWGRKRTWDAAAKAAQEKKKEEQKNKGKRP